MANAGDPTAAESADSTGRPASRVGAVTVLDPGSRSKTKVEVGPATSTASRECVAIHTCPCFTVSRRKASQFRKRSGFRWSSGSSMSSSPRRSWNRSI